jgi:hypothetical protein
MPLFMRNDKSVDGPPNSPRVVHAKMDAHDTHPHRTATAVFSVLAVLVALASVRDTLFSRSHTAVINVPPHGVHQLRFRSLIDHSFHEMTMYHGRLVSHVYKASHADYTQEIQYTRHGTFLVTGVRQGCSSAVQRSVDVGVARVGYDPRSVTHLSTHALVLAEEPVSPRWCRRLTPSDHAQAAERCGSTLLNRTSIPSRIIDECPPSFSSATCEYALAKTRAIYNTFLFDVVGNQWTNTSDQNGTAPSPYVVMPPSDAKGFLLRGPAVCEHWSTPVQQTCRRLFQCIKRKRPRMTTACHEQTPCTCTAAALAQLAAIGTWTACGDCTPQDNQGCTCAADAILLSQLLSVQPCQGRRTHSRAEAWPLIATIQYLPDGRGGKLEPVLVFEAGVVTVIEQQVVCQTFAYAREDCSP